MAEGIPTGVKLFLLVSPILLPVPPVDAATTPQEVASPPFFALVRSTKHAILGKWPPPPPPPPHSRKPLYPPASSSPKSRSDAAHTVKKERRERVKLLSLL